MIRSIRYLLDTNILSELRLRNPNSGVVRWHAETQASKLYLSVLTIGELRRGVRMRRDRGQNGADELDVWISDIEAVYGNRVLPIDLGVATVWGEISADRSRPVSDTLIAATAVAHSWTLLTLNTRDLS